MNETPLAHNEANICTHAGICNLAEPVFRELLTLRMQCDALLNHCDKEGGECSGCAAIICPDHDPLHFHHDGCPSCSLCSALASVEPVPVEARSPQGNNETISRSQTPEPVSQPEVLNSVDRSQAKQLLVILDEIDKASSWLSARTPLVKILAQLLSEPAGSVPSGNKKDL